MTDETNDAGKPGFRRRMIMQGAPALLAAAGMAAMMKPAAADAATGGPLPAHKRWKLVFVNHVTTNPFFVATQYGIARCLRLLRLRLPVDRLGDRRGR